MTEKRQKKQILKSIEQGHTEGTFTIVQKFLLALWASPKPQNQDQKQMALATLVSSQKQKLTIAKNFKKSDSEKAVFQRGISELFFMSLVDTRFAFRIKIIKRRIVLFFRSFQFGNRNYDNTKTF